MESTSTQTQEPNFSKVKKAPNTWITFRKEKLAEGVKNSEIRDLYYSSGMDKKSKQAKMEQALAEAAKEPESS
mgnify:CR=1 FL=1